MAKHHIPESHTAHPNVTPLIDIIMCLIIFFMLVAKIGVSSGAEKIDIPATALGSKIQDMSNTLTLNVPDGIGDEPVVTALLQSQLQPLALHDASGQNVLENTLKHFKAQNPDFKVIIRAKADLQWRFIEPILTSCNNAGVRTIDFNTKEVPAG